MSADARKCIDSFVENVTDTQLKTELQAIINDPSKAAVASLKDANAENQIADDPNAPVLPTTWTQQLGSFGLSVKKADDLLRHPFGMKTAADFINLLSDRG